jgi:serine phosphatase RsbU (regulator of sigma subunit)
MDILDQNGELAKKIAANVLLKSKLLFFTFIIIFIFQCFAIIFLSKSPQLSDLNSNSKIIFAPLFLIGMAALEFFFIRLSKSWKINSKITKPRILYALIAFEVTFPIAALFYICEALSDSATISAYDVLNSPLLIIIFIFIILSSLYLDFKASLISAIIPALGYFALNYAYIPFGSTQFPSGIAKSVFIILSGVICGIISKKIKEGIIESLESKDILINKLDFLVQEKTSELVKQNLKIENQKLLLEVKQKEVLDSINYAQRIQHTLLAHSEFIDKHLPENFVLFKPKDIVSGDFYWATYNKGRFYLAICDSTGHGVPGAFMSLLNISFLNEAINEKNIVEPNKVLDHVRKRLIENISKSRNDVVMGQDGMDGILVCFEENTITYAAANSAPVLVQNGVLIELAKDKMPVGISEKTESFSGYTLNANKGDIIYFFTDGYSDQFGGEKGKKFKLKQLHSKLSEHSSLRMSELKQSLDNIFENWKGELEQVDDVLVIGVRL